MLVWASGKTKPQALTSSQGHLHLQPHYTYSPILEFPGTEEITIPRVWNVSCFIYIYILLKFSYFCSKTVLLLQKPVLEKPSTTLRELENSDLLCQ